MCACSAVGAADLADAHLRTNCLSQGHYQQDSARYGYGIRAACTCHPAVGVQHKGAELAALTASCIAQAQWQHNNIHMCCTCGQTLKDSCSAIHQYLKAPAYLCRPARPVAGHIRCKVCISVTGRPAVRAPATALQATRSAAQTSHRE